jgi:hypothetical protein
MSKPLDVRMRLDAPHLDAEHRLRPVLAAYARRRGVARAPKAGAAFPPQHFGLERVGAFVDLPPARRAAVSAACAEGLLGEAYFIEKAGLCYCAKLVLLSETTEERMAFSLIAADEATHLELLGRFVDGSQLDPSADPFLALLSELVETGDKQSLILLLQVVLEGWGLTHYRNLQRGACDADLAAAFAAILRDEALHHATGKALFRADAMGRVEREFALEVMARFLQMVQVGPQRVVAALAAGCGGLTRAQRAQVFEDLRSEEDSSAKLELLRGLMLESAPSGFVDALAARGAFRPFGPEVCADLAG